MSAPSSARPQASAGQASGADTQSSAHLNHIVLDYLSKKGYPRTEAAFRAEAAGLDANGRSMLPRTRDAGGPKYKRGYDLLRGWIENNLDIYKAGLRRFLWPIFVYTFLRLISDGEDREGRSFFSEYKAEFLTEHHDDVQSLESISLPEHATQNETAKIYLGARYRLTINSVAFFNLIRFLEAKQKEGGAILVGIIQDFLNVVTSDREYDSQYSLAQALNRDYDAQRFPAEDEGIPGHNPGSANTNRTAVDGVLTKLRLGPLEYEDELKADVKAELEQEDIHNPPLPAQPSLSDHFISKVKQEYTEDSPTRAELQMPPSVARDVAMEVQKIKEDRDRFKIEARTGGTGPNVSVTMFTFHNTQDSVNCIDFSEDNLLVAIGTSESYIRVWRLNGEAMPSKVEGEAPVASRRLIGHSGPVYAISFSPCAASTYPDAPSTNAKFLLSAAADTTVRLWSLDTWTCLVMYRSHTQPVWDVTWGPFGLYFLTGSHDRTARLWRTDHIADLRMFVGHDKGINCVAFHPNGAYVFSGSSDKIVRMWAVTNGYPVRMFTGHPGIVVALSCSPNGKVLASADDAGTIILWDLASGRLKKRMRGHSRGGIWSLSWSVESNILVSGAADGTVRVWDIDPPETVKDGSSVTGTRSIVDGAIDKAENATSSALVAAPVTKKKTKEVVVTADQLSAFPTKKSPVYKVRFTRQNLVVAGGAYLP